MREDVKTFHLRLDGTEALNKTQVTKLASGLGQLQTVEMKGSRSELYGDYAIITTKAPLAWSWPRNLRYRAYNADFEVRLSLVPEVCSLWKFCISLLYLFLNLCIVDLMYYI